MENVLAGGFLSPDWKIRKVVVAKRSMNTLFMWWHATFNKVLIVWDTIIILFMIKLIEIAFEAIVEGFLEV